MTRFRYVPQFVIPPSPEPTGWFEFEGKSPDDFVNAYATWLQSARVRWVKEIESESAGAQKETNA